MERETELAIVAFGGAGKNLIENIRPERPGGASLVLVGEAGGTNAAWDAIVSPGEVGDAL